VNELEKIVAVTRQEVARRLAHTPVSELERAAAARDDTRSFTAAIASPGLSLIAEHKRRSPSAGVIRDGAALEQIVAAYERGGARALSVLTDGPSFGGSLDDLRAAKAAATLPVLRKDFIIDPYQVAESHAAGADAILLIVAALSGDQLASLHEAALQRDMAALVEVHDRAELEIAAQLGAKMIGINNRDLTTLKVDTRRTFELLPDVPDDALVVAESGFGERAQLDELSEAGVDGVLIGEALMRAPDVDQACLKLTV
jgi:indole-3-glycerol phosphate synthase